MGSSECHVLLKSSFLKYGCWWWRGPICSLFCLSIWNHFRRRAVRVSILLWAFLSVSGRADRTLPPRGRKRSAERGQKAAATLFPAEEGVSGLSPPLRHVFVEFCVPSRCLGECLSNVTVRRPPRQRQLWLFHTIALIWNLRSLGFWVFSSETKFAKLVLLSFLSFTIIKIDFSNGMWWNKCDPDEELILTQYSNTLFNVLWSTNDFNTHSLNVASEELCVVVCYYLQLQGRGWEISRRGSSVAARLSLFSPRRSWPRRSRSGPVGAAGLEGSVTPAAHSALAAEGGILWLKEKMSSVWVSLFPSLEVITPFLFTFYAFTTSFNKGCVTSLEWYLIFIRRNSLQGELSVPYANRLLIVVTQ